MMKRISENQLESVQKGLEWMEVSKPSVAARGELSHTSSNCHRTKQPCDTPDGGQKRNDSSGFNHALHATDPVPHSATHRATDGATQASAGSPYVAETTKDAPHTVDGATQASAGSPYVDQPAAKAPHTVVGTSDSATQTSAGSPYVGQTAADFPHTSDGATQAVGGTIRAPHESAFTDHNASGSAHVHNVSHTSGPSFDTANLLYGEASACNQGTSCQSGLLDDPEASYNRAFTAKEAVSLNNASSHTTSANDTLSSSSTATLTTTSTATMTPSGIALPPHERHCGRAHPMRGTNSEDLTEWCIRHET